MSKELEALKILKANAILFDDGTDFGASMLEAICDIEKSLTPPTADEVREALQLFWGNNYKVNVSITNQIFIESKKDKDGDSCIEWDGEKIYFDWMPCYPPHLITLIGRFYEGEIK